MSEEEKLPRKIWSHFPYDFKPVAPMPPNTLTNADGTPYQAGYDDVDEQKAQLYARHFAQKYGARLFDKAHSTKDIWIFEHLLKENIEEFALEILKETSSQ